MCVRGDPQRPYTDVKTLFNETFRGSNDPILKSTVKHTLNRFEEAGNVKGCRIPGQPISAATAEKQLCDVLLVVENPHLSIRRSGQQHVVGNMAVHRNIRRHSSSTRTKSI